MKKVVISMLVMSLLRTAAATTVLVYISPQGAFLATDSLANRLGGGQRQVCKIAQASRSLLFAQAGFGITEIPHFDPYEIARSVGSKDPNPHEAADKYEATALPGIEDLWRRNRSRYIQMGQSKQPGSFVFVGLNRDRQISFSGADFIEDPANPLGVVVSNSQERTVKGANDYFLYSFGVTEGLPTAAVINEWIARMGAPTARRNAIEMQSKATPELVGGRISIVRLQPDGSVDWIDRGECCEAKSSKTSCQDRSGLAISTSLAAGEKRGLEAMLLLEDGFVYGN